MNKTTAKCLLAIFALVWGAGLFCAKVLADSQSANGRSIDNDVNNTDLNLTIKSGGTRLTVFKGVGTAGSQAGGVRLGASMSANNTNNPLNVIYGGLWGGGAGSGDDYFSTTFGANAYLGSAPSKAGRGYTGTGGTALVLSGRTSDGDYAAEFWANQVGDSTTTLADRVGSITQNGKWTLGRSNDNQQHDLYGMALVQNNASNGYLKVKTTVAAGYADLYLDSGSAVGALPRVIFQKNDVEKGRIYTNDSSSFVVEAPGGLTLQNPVLCGNVCGGATGTAHSNITGTIDSVLSLGNRLWTRIGNTVAISFALYLDTGAQGIGTVQVNLPLASNFTDVNDAQGVCTGYGGSSMGGFSAETANDRLLFTNRNYVTDGVYVVNCTGHYVIK